MRGWMASRVCGLASRYPSGRRWSRLRIAGAPFVERTLCDSRRGGKMQRLQGLTDEIKRSSEKHQGCIRCLVQCFAQPAGSHDSSGGIRGGTELRERTGVRASLALNWTDINRLRERRQNLADGLTILVSQHPKNHRLESLWKQLLDCFAQRLCAIDIVRSVEQQFMCTRPGYPLQPSRPIDRAQPCLNSLRRTPDDTLKHRNRFKRESSIEALMFTEQWQLNDSRRGIPAIHDC